MEEAFILQVSLEMGLGGGSECVAYELHRAWLALGLDARVLNKPGHRTRTAAGNYLCGALADGLGACERAGDTWLRSLLCLCSLWLRPGVRIEPAEQR